MESKKTTRNETTAAKVSLQDGSDYEEGEDYYQYDPPSPAYANLYGKLDEVL